MYSVRTAYPRSPPSQSQAAGPASPTIINLLQPTYVLWYGWYAPSHIWPAGLQPRNSADEVLLASSRPSRARLPPRPRTYRSTQYRRPSRKLPASYAGRARIISLRRHEINPDCRRTADKLRKHLSCSPPSKPCLNLTPPGHLGHTRGSLTRRSHSCTASKSRTLLLPSTPAPPARLPPSRVASSRYPRALETCRRNSQPREERGRRAWDVRSVVNNKLAAPNRAAVRTTHHHRKRLAHVPRLVRTRKP